MGGYHVLCHGCSLLLQFYIFYTAYYRKYRLCFSLKCQPVFSVCCCFFCKSLNMPIPTCKVCLGVSPNVAPETNENQLRLNRTQHYAKEPFLKSCLLSATNRRRWFSSNVPQRCISLALPLRHPKDASAYSQLGLIFSRNAQLPFFVANVPFCWTRQVLCSVGFLRSNLGSSVGADKDKKGKKSNKIAGLYYFRCWNSSLAQFVFIKHPQTEDFPGSNCDFPPLRPGGVFLHDQPVPRGHRHPVLRDQAAGERPDEGAARSLHVQRLHAR